MKFEEVLDCLENAEKRSDLISKLKTKGEKSLIFQSLKDVMIQLKMNKPPKGVENKTNLQQIFQNFQVY
jgi:hypothetical protein